MAKSHNLFNVKNKEVKFSWIDPDFIKWFGEMHVNFDKHTNRTLNYSPLTSQKLPRFMTSREILDELKPTEVSLGDIYETLKALDHSVLALFFVKDDSEVLRSVSARWSDDYVGWNVYANDASRSYQWGVVRQLFSRNSHDPVKLGSSDTMTSDPLTVEKRVAALEKKLAEIGKILKS